MWFYTEPLFCEENQWAISAFKVVLRNSFSFGTNGIAFFLAKVSHISVWLVLETSVGVFDECSYPVVGSFLCIPWCLLGAVRGKLLPVVHIICCLSVMYRDMYASDVSDFNAFFVDEMHSWLWILAKLQHCFFYLLDALSNAVACNSTHIITLQIFKS